MDDLTSPSGSSAPTGDADFAWTTPRPLTDQRIAMEAIAAELRAVHHALHDAEASADELTETLALAKALRKATSGFAQRNTTPSPSSTEVDLTQISFVDVSPMSGRSSALAPPLNLELVDRRCIGTVNFGSAFEGPPGHVHGGWIAAAFDEVQGVVQGIDGAPGMTATLDIAYRQPTPLHTDLTFTAWIEKVRGRRIHTKATLEDHSGKLLCESTGLFVTVDFEAFRAKLAAD